MKNLKLTLLIAVIVLAGAWMPFQASKSWGNETPLITECFHVSDGVRDGMPYTAIAGGGICPPCGSIAACANSAKHVEHVNAAAEGNGNPNHTVELPPSMCTEEGVEEW